MQITNQPHRSKKRKPPKRRDHIPKEKLKMIMEKTIKNGECLEWTGNYFLDKRKNHEKSYPYIYWKNKVWRGNRLVLFLVTGIEPKDKFSCHHCDNKNA